MDIYAIILAGGSGTRFWPLSRESCPKQMLRIMGDETLINQTIARFTSIMPHENILVVTTRRQSKDIDLHINPTKKKDQKKIKIIAEPFGRNTAAAIGLAAAYLNKASQKSIMIVSPSDHAIGDGRAFSATIKAAAKGAMQGYLVTIGIKPTRPETAYGYIKTGKVFKKPLYHVHRFVEKPDMDIAKKYIEDGYFFWNSGIFVWRTSDILTELKRHMPHLYSGIERIRKAIGTENEQEIIEAVYSRLDDISIDYGVLEKSKNTLTIPSDMQWSDAGSWNALDDIVEKNKDGNIIKGNVIDIGSNNSIIFGEDRLVATIGLKDIIVADTADATLICPKDRAQDVRQIVTELKRRGADEYLIHRTVERPWGSYTVLEKGKGFKIKRIVVNPGGKLSLQAHYHRSEHWVVVSGTARVTRGDEIIDVHTNESTYIPMSTRHRLENPGLIPLQMIEVQSGEYLEEDDIERFEDEYGR